MAPYVYADQSEDAQVVALIDDLAAGRVDAIAFTSSPQVRRLFAVARKNEQDDALRAALERTVVAAVGPLVAEALNRHEIPVDTVPGESYSMKPMVRASIRALAGGKARAEHIDDRINCGVESGLAHIPISRAGVLCRPASGLPGTYQ